MTALLKMLARSGVVLGNPFHAKRHYIRPRPGDARRDFAQVAQAMRSVDRDLCRVLKQGLDKS